jgi:hypothetical protein
MSMPILLTSKPANLGCKGVNGGCTQGLSKELISEIEGTQLDLPSKEDVSWPTDPKLCVELSLRIQRNQTNKEAVNTLV